MDISIKSSSTTLWIYSFARFFAPYTELVEFIGVTNEHLERH
jgi:hypothetical protein